MTELNDIKQYESMSQSDKMNFIACNNENVMNMLDYFITNYAPKSNRPRHHF